MCQSLFFNTMRLQYLFFPMNIAKVLENLFKRLPLTVSDQCRVSIPSFHLFYTRIDTIRR